MSSNNVIYHTHNDGTKIQGIGLGTYTSMGFECEAAVRQAVKVGYRHIDTAAFYENESEVGDALNMALLENNLKREDMFIVTKLWNHMHEPERVERACRKSLLCLRLDYLDLYLMHWPYSYVYHGDTILMPVDEKGDVEISDIDFLDTWKAMENLVEMGLTKSIGVSNFNIEQLKRLLANCKIKPIHNQIECHPYLNQRELIEFCKNHDILVTAYCPLARPDSSKESKDLMNDPEIAQIAKYHNKTPAQVVLRYLVEIGTVPIPKSVTFSRIEENFNIWDFKLRASDVQKLDSFNCGKRLIAMEHAKSSRYYPFEIKA